MSVQPVSEYRIAGFFHVPKLLFFREKSDVHFVFVLTSTTQTIPILILRLCAFNFRVCRLENEKMKVWPDETNPLYGRQMSSPVTTALLSTSRFWSHPASFKAIHLVPAGFKPVSAGFKPVQVGFEAVHPAGFVVGHYLSPAWIKPARFEAGWLATKWAVAAKEKWDVVGDALHWRWLKKKSTIFFHRIRCCAILGQPKWKCFAQTVEAFVAVLLPSVGMAGGENLACLASCTCRTYQHL